MHKHEGKKGGRGGWKQHGNGSTRIQMLSSLTWNFDGTKLQVLRRIQKHARRLIIPRNCTVCSELSWTREHDEAHTQWTARHARFRTTLSGDTSRKTAHRSTSKSPLHAAAQIDQLLRKISASKQKIIHGLFYSSTLPMNVTSWMLLHLIWLHGSTKITSRWRHVSVAVALRWWHCKITLKSLYIL